MDSRSSLKVSMLGKLVLSSGLVHSSWSKISELQADILRFPNQDPAGLRIRTYPEADSKHTFVVFSLTRPSNHTNITASTLLPGSQDQNPFHFLCSEKISSFSLLTSALELFLSAYNQNFLNLKQKLLELLKSKKPVIITGANLGGSVASLFTLWLLETIDPKLQRPLCITFGSPLIGDGSLQQTLENSLRNSCFLHVVDVAGTPVKAGFKPFGTFLICYLSECICIEDTETVMELISGGDTDLTGWRDYGEVLNRLDGFVLSMADSGLMIDDVIVRMKERAEKKTLLYDQLKKLGDMKILMADIERYKMVCKMHNIGYYDRFKTHIACSISAADTRIQSHVKELKEYWKSMVEEVEKKPQGEKSVLKTRCLFSGHNYRRLVEPLDIAEYYANGNKEYRASGRSHHYVMLEKWFKEEAMEPPVRHEGSDLSDLLTFDSCFWAKVEEAMIVMIQLRTEEGIMREELVGKVMRFEEYVWGMIRKREVSPEIFLEKSSFMKWWKEYKEIIGEINGFNSKFIEYMNTGKYESYGQSSLN